MNAAARPSPSHFARAFIIWVVLSVIADGVALLIGPYFVDWGILPSVASARAEDINQVLRLFTLLSLPVFFMVVVFAGYSVFQFRSRGRPDTDGPPVRGNQPFQLAWLAVSIVLVVVLFGYGLVFLSNVNAAPTGDVLQVNVTGEQWLRDYSYPQYNNISGSLLELPVGRPVMFTIHSIDVQHSFWIPSFGIKQDAVPGEVTHISVTPNKIGEYVVRCAELCGLYHAYMNTPVKVVSSADFDAWVASQQASSATGRVAPAALAVGERIVQRSSLVLGRM